ncbi:hypothetical protein [Caballeronia sp. RCC_10]|uniref:hypothetical protein n=1 Tax=Caballeronia sp. RCC_10 TaxID=3239227 RepID=UPI0035236412
MDDELFLGKVIRNEASWARMEPLAVRIAGQWKKIENPLELFPTQGRVFSTRPLLNAPMDSLWTFTQRPNERRDMNGPDLLLAEDIVRATPIVDLSSISLETARRRLFNQGVDLAVEFSTVTTVILLPGDLFCDIALTRNPDGLWRSGSLTRPVQLKEMPKGWKSSLEFYGLRVMPAQDVPHGPVVRTVNWCSDQDFVERVIERFRKFMQNVGDTPYARPSKDAVKYISRALRQADLMPGQDNDILLDMERLQADWPILETRLAASEQLSSLILGLKGTKEKVEAEVELARRRAADEARPVIERQVRLEAEASLAASQRQLDALQEEVLKLEERRAHASTDLDDLEKRRVDIQTQQSAISDGLRSVAAELRTSLAQSPFQTRPALSFVAERLEDMLTEHGYHGPSLLPSALPPWANSVASDGPAEIGYDALTMRISQESKRHGVEEEALRLIDIFARSGELVLLCGPQSELALQAYASCVSGGSYRTMPLDPSTIGLDDLWRAPGTQAPTAFAHAWQAALGAPDSPHILCIRDIDAAPYRLWLASFRTVLQGAARPPNLLVFAMSTGRNEGQSVAPAGDDNRSDYLVPVCPEIHREGAVCALASAVAPLTSSSRLTIDPNAVPSDLEANDWMRRVVTLDLPPSALIRLARFRNRFMSDAEQLMAAVQGWGQFLGSKDMTHLPSCISDGLTAMTN